MTSFASGAPAGQAEPLTSGPLITNSAQGRPHVISGRPVPQRTFAARNTALLGCLVFGICTILNIHPMGDGAWFWYADALRHGQHLYSGLHLPLQPVYVLEMRLAMACFGQGWLALKIPAVLHLIAFCLGLWLICREMEWSDRALAVLLAAGFLFSTLFVAFRLDDYHVISDSCEVYSIYLLLRLARQKQQRWAWMSAGLGVLCGLSATTRLNDGGMLFLCAGACLLLMLDQKRTRAAAVMLFATLATALCAVLLTGDSVGAYLSTAVFHAAQSKGGTSHLAQYPLLLARNVARGLIGESFFRVRAAIWLALITGITVGIRQVEARKTGASLNVLKSSASVLSILLSSLGLLHDLRHHDANDVAPVAFCLMAMILLMVYGAVLACQLPGSVRAGGVRRRRYALHALMLIPLGQLLSSSLSSAGAPWGLYAPVGIAVLLLPVVWDADRSWALRTGLLVAIALVSISIVRFKAQYPFSWHSYVEAPMFRDRMWFHHPAYGPMYIEKSQLALVQQVCSDVRASGSPELLSIPMPYANYFCQIPPWHGYIQTFYDTSSPVTVDRLRNELATAPPTWIFYQHQPLILRLHELVYNGGRPLPQRAVEELILNNVHSGAWKLISDTPLGHEADYMLIRTH